MNLKFIISCLGVAFLMPVQTSQAKYLEDKSDNWSIEQEHAFGRVSKVYVDFKTDKTIFCDLPLSNNSDGQLTVKKFQNWLLKKMNSESNSIEFLSLDEEIKENDFIAEIFIKEITEKGGADLQMKLFRNNKPDLKKYFSFKAKDRKWNDTETLLKENVDQLGEELESDIWWAARNGARR